MPSYIELNKNSSFPASSNSGKLIFGVNTNDKAALTDHLGNTVEIGGGGTGIVIPEPQIHIIGYPINQLNVKFSDTSFLTEENNAELFLFRWRNNHRTKVNNPITRRRRKKSKWFHPSTSSADTKWQGWKFFNGKQYDTNGFEITGRTTEWALPTNLLPYQLHSINFNEYLFWNIEDKNTNVITADTNVFSVDSFSPTLHDTTNYKINIGGSNRSRNANIIKYSLAIAIDNPEANKTNGLCPKIFGPFSEPFYTIIDQTNGGISIIKGNDRNHKHVIKNILN